MAKVLAMEIGQGITKVMEIDYKSKAPRIYNAFTLDTPKEMVQDGVISRNEDFIIELKSQIRKREIRTDQIVFTVSSSRIANREARIPLCKENKILSLITANAADYFPVDMNQYHLVYNILGKEEDKEKNEKQYRLSILAVPNDVTTSYLDLAHSLGMHIKAMDYMGNSIYQATKEASAGATGATAILKIDPFSSLITIINKGEIALQRTIAHGVNNAIELMQDMEVFGETKNYSDATQAFIHNRCIRRYINVDMDYQEQEDTSDEMMMSRITLTESLRYLVGNISRILEYYVSRNGGEGLEKVLLVGLGGDFIGLDELLTNELGYEVKSYQGLSHMKVLSSKYPLDISMRLFIACYGATIQPLQLLSPELLKSEKQTSLAIPFSVMVAGVVIAVALSMISSVQLAAEQSKLDEAQKRMDNSQYIVPIQRNHSYTAEAYEYLKKYEKIELNNNSQLLAFISEMEKYLPKSFNTLSLSVTNSGISFSCTCDSKEAAAEIINSIRTRFRTISVLSTSGFSETQVDENLMYPIMDEEGAIIGYEDADGNVLDIDPESEDYEPNLKTQVGFSLSLTYRNVTEE